MPRPVLPLSLLVASVMTLGGVAAGPAAAEGAVARPPAGCPRVTVDADANSGWVQTSRVHLRIREYPTTRSRVLGQLPPCAVVAVVRRESGQRVGGTRTWYRLEGRRGWISGAYARQLRPVLAT
ncbi:SH3 domain-containing protein [Streptomyces sp. NPDC047123]|uniref:SH3 domain-containing protein n=1 Tax=Streptomyces sp. NPDC047123 TaxID=3155622 RepID=UPI0033DF4317